MDLSSLGVKYILNESIKEYTTFKVGGRCKAMLFPTTKSEFFSCVNFATPNYVVLGNGSNVLVSDNGYDGYVINTLKLKKIKLIGNVAEVECGAKVRDVISVLQQNSLGGMEFLVGVPGTIGGLVAMNGGCYNKTISELVCYVKTTNGVFNNQTCKFGYRTSALSDKAIYSVGLKLPPLEREDIDRKILHFEHLRKNKQPKGNSCGSVFLNDGYFAGKVIDQHGLKGCKIGGAFVSPTHANFIINDGGTATDVYKLIQHVKSVVYQQSGIMLKEEVRYIGNF